MTSSSEPNDAVPVPPAPGSDSTTPPAAGSTPAEETSAAEAALRAELAAAQDAATTARKDAAEAHDRYLRAIADHENYRKRALRERDETRTAATGRVIEDLLPVMDTLGLALGAVQAPGADAKVIASGVSMVVDQFRSATAQHGLKEINPLGQPFDPNLHEAIAQQPSPTVPEGSVLQVIRSGYQLHQRLLRAASVIVSTGPAPAAEPAIDVTATPSV